jgi:hypothetical protein
LLIKAGWCFDVRFDQRVRVRGKTSAKRIWHFARSDAVPFWFELIDRTRRTDVFHDFFYLFIFALCFLKSLLRDLTVFGLAEVSDVRKRTLICRKYCLFALSPTLSVYWFAFYLSRFQQTDSDKEIWQFSTVNSYSQNSVPIYPSSSFFLRSFCKLAILDVFKLKVL